MINRNTHPFCFVGNKYARDVVEGKIVACKFTIGACERYFRDLENPDSHFYFDVESAEKFLRLVQKFEHVIGTWQTKEVVFEPWQNFVWMCVMGFLRKDTKLRRFRTAHIEVGRGNGKAHCVKSKVPTPDGMKLWGDIEIGSRLYDRQGNVCRVTGKTPTHFPQAYEISFSDGTTHVCSDKHLWFTSTRVERARKVRHVKRHSSSRKALRNTAYENVRTTREISNSLLTGSAKPGTNHSIKNTLPIKGEKQKLGVDPYILGYWLGNGSTGGARVHCHEDDLRGIKSLFKKRGCGASPTQRKKESRGVSFLAKTLHPQLKKQGLLGNKHIPEKYFLATAEERLELVRGLLDSDGSINQAMRGQVEFTNKNGKLAGGLNRLLCSLGYKTSQGRFKVPENNNFASDTNFYRVSFYPRGARRVFNLKRKYDKQIPVSGKHSYVGQRYIVGAKKLNKSRPMFCVEVDSPDNSYLITENYIPTHNSLMASTAALYFMALDNPSGNQVAAVATKKDQARIVLDSSRAMARKNKSFLRNKGVRVLAHSIVQERTNSLIRALAAEASGLDGLNDVLAVCDELHAMKRDVFEVISSGMSKRSDSLILCITTAGFDIDSVGYSQSTYAKKVATGEVTDDQFFSIVYCLDEGDDIFDESVWIKANPNWAVSVDPITFRAKMEKAKSTPADIPNLKVKHLNLWISEAHAFFDTKKWAACANPNLRLEDFNGQKCRMGIDLASHVDLTSIGLVFFRDGKYYIFDKTYIPEKTVQETRSQLYDDSIARGFLIQTPGAAINYDFIRDQATVFANQFRVSECLYDTWNATEMAQKLSNKIEMVKFGMNTANLSEPMKKLDALMREGKIVHNGSPLLQWCVGNVVAKRDHNDNVFPRKSHARLKIDPVIAVLMALAGWLMDEQKESVYEGRGIRSF